MEKNRIVLNTKELGVHIHLLEDEYSSVVKAACYLFKHRLSNSTTVTSHLQEENQKRPLFVLLFDKENNKFSGEFYDCLEYLMPYYKDVKLTIREYYGLSTI